MLSKFRGMFTGTMGRIFVPLFAAVVILAFAFTGVPELRNFGQRPALKVGASEYSATEVQEEFTRQLDIYRRQTGDSLTNEEAVQAGLLTRTVSALKGRALLREETDTLGLVATNEMVGEYLRSEPTFANPETGEFDQQYLAAILQANRMSLPQLRDTLEEELVRTQLLDSIGATMPAPHSSVDLLLKRQGESREISWVELAPAADSIEAPSEDQLRGYYDAHTDDYMAPEYRIFRVVTLRNDDFAEGLERSEDELRQLFEARRAYLSTPETRTVRQLTYQNSADAEAAYSRLTGGTPFEQLAEEQGLEIGRITYEGVSRDDLADPQIAEALFSAEQAGAVIGPIDGLFGYTIGEVLEITPGEEASFEEQREALEAELSEGETSRRLFEAIETVELARDEGATLEQAVEEAGVADFVTVGPVDRDLFTPDGAIVEDLPLEILTEAFLLEEGDETAFLDLEAGDGYFAVILDEVRPAQIRPFEEVRAEVRRAFMLDRRRAAAQEQLARLRTALDGGASLAEAAESVGASVTTRRLGLQNVPPAMPADFVEGLFSAGLDSLVTGSGDNGTAWAGKVRSVSYQDVPQRDQIVELYSNAAGQQIAAELTDAYLLTLENEIDVREDREQLDRLFNYGEQ